MFVVLDFSFCIQMLIVLIMPRLLSSGTPWGLDHIQKDKTGKTELTLGCLCSFCARLSAQLKLCTAVMIKFKKTDLAVTSQSTSLQDFNDYCQLSQSCLRMTWSSPQKLTAYKSRACRENESLILHGSLILQEQLCQECNVQEAQDIGAHNIRKSMCLRCHEFLWSGWNFNGELFGLFRGS